MEWLLLFLFVLLMAGIASISRRVDTLWYFHKHGDSAESKDFRKYIGE